LLAPPTSTAYSTLSLHDALPICLEALQNTAKYAHASSARICLQVQNGTLRFTVSDDGTGYDTSRTPMGSGLRNMADRLAALRGRSEEHTSELQSRVDLVCRLLLE